MTTLHYHYNEKPQKIKKLYEKLALKAKLSDQSDILTYC